MISLSLWLYGRPEWDLPIKGKIKPTMFKEHGEYLKEHLHRVAEIVEKLQTANWDCDMALYTLEFYKKGMTKLKAETELERLEINLKEMHIEEFEDDEE